MPAGPREAVGAECRHAHPDHASGGGAPTRVDAEPRERRLAHACHERIRDFMSRANTACVRFGETEDDRALVAVQARNGPARRVSVPRWRPSP
jgi:hypothetical protein